jgi:hypothetical protein
LAKFDDAGQQDDQNGKKQGDFDQTLAFLPVLFWVRFVSHSVSPENKPQRRGGRSVNEKEEMFSFICWCATFVLSPM